MTNATPRFSFPGFELVDQRDSPTHDIEIGTIEQGGVKHTVHLLRRKGSPYYFLISSVWDESGKDLWRFDKTTDGIAVLAMAGEDETVIAYLGRGPSGKVEKIVPFSTLGSEKPMDLRRKSQLKRLAAEFLKREAAYSPAERAVMKAVNDRERQHKADERKATAARRQADKVAFNQKVAARDMRVAFAADGRTLKGFPVVDGEWQRLDNGVFVILVESFNEKTRVTGEAIEAFRVLKEKGGNPAKQFATPVSWQNKSSLIETGPARPAMPQPCGATVIEIDGEFHEVALYNDWATIQRARHAGLNAGTLVAVKSFVKGTAITVRAIHADRVVDLGKFQPLEE